MEDDSGKIKLECNSGKKKKEKDLKRIFNRRLFSLNLEKRKRTKNRRDAINLPQSEIERYIRA